MNKHATTNSFSGCLLYALATLPLTALVVTGGVWLERLGVWSALWRDSANVLCCFLPCLGVAIPFGLLGYYLPQHRGTFLHHLAQMTDHRGLGLLDECLFAGTILVGISALFFLPVSNPVIYLPVALVLLAVFLRWTLRDLIAVVPFDEQGSRPDLVALGQQSRMTADDLRDYNFPPGALRIPLAGSAGLLGQMQAGAWRLELWSASVQAGQDPTRQTVRLVGTLTNIGSAPGSVEHLPDWKLRDAYGREAAPHQVTTTPLKPGAVSFPVVAPGAAVSLTLSFEVGAMERSVELLARSRELLAGDEIVVPF
jgi:hypothetical protein